MNVNDKIREVAKETEALVEENKRLEDSLRKQRHLKDEYKQMADEAVGQVQDLREPSKEQQQTIARNVELQADNEKLRELSKAQQQKLNNIHEEAAKAHYEAELWQKRFEAIEKCIQDRLEITPASIPYDNVRLMLKAIKRHDLHGLD